MPAHLILKFNRACTKRLVLVCNLSKLKIKSFSGVGSCPRIKARGPSPDPPLPFATVLLSEFSTKLVFVNSRAGVDALPHAQSFVENFCVEKSSHHWFMKRSRKSMQGKCGKTACCLKQLSVPLTHRRSTHQIQQGDFVSGRKLCEVQ